MTAGGSIARRLEALLAHGFERAPAPPPVTDVTRVSRRLLRLVSTRAAMGTHVRLTLLGGAPGRLEEAAGRAFDETDRLIALLTRFEPAAPVAVLNALGCLEGPPPEVVDVVTSALDFHALSAGAFDVSVAPLLALFSAHLDCAEPSAPSPAEVREALSRVGAEHVAVSGRRVAFLRAGMGVTLDGIAKGYIVDAIARVLERRGVARYLVDAGGDIRAAGSNERGEPWAVAVKDPAGGDGFPDVMRLRDGAVATSGSYESFFQSSGALHHIVDPGSGRSPSHSVSVSVRARTAMAADALATSVFVMPPEAGLALMDRLPGCACLMLDGAGSARRSRNWISARPPEPLTRIEVDA